MKIENELNEYILDCFNKVNYLIICKSEKNIILDTKKRYYFYYKKENSGSQITFNTKDIFEDNRRISLIFHPKVPSHQLLFRNNRRFIVKNKNNIISGGYLYITRKVKKILKKPKNGFNKNIELNNFIYSGGFESHFPPWSLINYKEAIRKGYKIVDADIMFTKDKIPVISHDRQLRQISNGNGDLTKKTIEELDKLDFGIKFNKKYSGEKILKFENLLKLCKENKIIIDLDLFHLNYPEFFKDMNEYIKIIIDYVEKYEMWDSIIFNDQRQYILDIFYSIKKEKFKNEILNKNIVFRTLFDEK